MTDKTKDNGTLLKRPLRRRELIKGGIAATALVAGSSIFAPRIVRGAGGSITIGSFQDNAMAPFRDYFVKAFTDETGIAATYNETNYDSWYQSCKNDGLNKTGAYDIYVMDDNWVPEFAAARIVQSLDQLGFKANPDILPKGLEMGLWPPKSGARMKDFASATPELYSIVIIDDVEILYYHADYFPSAPETWDDIFKVAQTTKAPDLYGWSARGVKGNPIVMTYLPLLNSYGGNFVNDDWTPGFAGPEGVAALSRLFSFIPYMPEGVAAFDTAEETQVMLEGKCTALTEYTGLVNRVDDPSSSKVVGKINMVTTPKQEKHGPAIGTFIASVSSGAKNPEGAVQFLEWFTSSKIQLEFARKYGGAAVTGSALTDAEAKEKHRWLPAIAESVNNSVQKPRTPDEPKMEDLLGTALNEALVEAIATKANYDAIAQKHLQAAADQITDYLKQQGGYF
ncbi:MAG: extracellular solute-binding protein [Dongiaceae bacterium]